MSEIKRGQIGGGGRAKAWEQLSWIKNPASRVGTDSGATIY